MSSNNQQATAEAKPKPSGNNAPTQEITQDDAKIVKRLLEARKTVKQEMAKVVVGQEGIIDDMLVGLLCRGHVLLHGVPGLGKTLMGRSLARTLQMEFKRIQFTPDLMPSDITGTDVIEEDHSSGKHVLQFMPGPVFTNFLLADEINRTPPKTQAALLQAMQEREVSVGTKTYTLDPPFFVVATQNPIEMEGTYPLPEAQVDRFMFNLKVRYPTIDEEVQIIKGTTSTVTGEVSEVMKAEEVVRLQDLVRGVPVSDSGRSLRGPLGRGDSSRRGRRGGTRQVGRDSQVHWLWGESPCFAVPRVGSQGTGDSVGQVPRRLRGH